MCKRVQDSYVLEKLTPFLTPLTLIKIH
jgi:hypothetical protein